MSSAFVLLPKTSQRTNASRRGGDVSDVLTSHAFSVDVGEELLARATKSSRPFVTALEEGRVDRPGGGRYAATGASEEVVLESAFDDEAVVL